MSKPIVENLRGEFGLSGGVYITGSVNINCSAYAYYPLTACSASIVTSNITNGEKITGTFLAGITIYGNITAVSQSSGTSIVYNYINPSR